MTAELSSEMGRTLELAAISADTVLWIAVLAASLLLVRRLWRSLRRGPSAGGRCPPENNKVVFGTQADAQRSVERSRARYAAGRVSKPLDHEYRCPHHDHWHVSSKPQRR